MFSVSVRARQDMAVDLEKGGTEMQKAASMASALVLIFSTNCAIYYYAVQHMDDQVVLLEKMGERRVALHRRRGSTEADSGEQECAYPLQVGAHHDHDHDDGHGDDNTDEGHRAGLCLCLPSSGGLLHKRSQLHSCRYLKLQLI